MRKIITTSWDDGHPLDFRIASLLEKYGLQGTFYIPLSNPEREVMHASQIQELAGTFEIGGHTLHHASLNTSDAGFLKAEINGGKVWMEQLLGKKTTSFCYPKGLYSAAAVETVKQAGYSYARTVELLETEISDNLLSPTSVQLYKHPASVYFLNPLKRSGMRGLGNYWKYAGSVKTLELLTNRMLERIALKGGVFHLWGHSWEIEQENLWDELEVLLGILAQRTDFQKVNNSMLVQKPMVA
jgi:hypothetical protein